MVYGISRQRIMKRLLEYRWLLLISGGLILLAALITVMVETAVAQTNPPAATVALTSAGTVPAAQTKPVTAEKLHEEQLPVSATATNPIQQTAVTVGSTNPDQIIKAMQAYYDAQQVRTGCLPYRPTDVEVGKVVEVYSHDRYKVSIPSRDKTIDVALIGVSSHTQDGKKGDAKHLAETLTRGKNVLLIRGTNDKRGNDFARYVVTSDGLFLNYEVMQYSIPLVSAIEDDGCYSIFLAKANPDLEQ
jgi:hypothetical protein